MKSTRNQVFGIIAAAQAIVVGIQEAFEEQLKAIDSIGLQWAVIIVAAFCLLVTAKVVYYKHVWKWLNRKIDLQGSWEFRSSYLPSFAQEIEARHGASATGALKDDLARLKGYDSPVEGEVTITQDPDGIEWFDVPKSDYPSPASARTLSVEFNEKDTLFCLVEITVISNTDPGAFFTYLQTEVITITEWAQEHPKRPMKMRGMYRTALMNESDLIQARKIMANWTPPMGTTIYTRKTDV